MTRNNHNQTPTVLVIFGVTGDLAKRKLIPALFHLWQEEALPEAFRIIGFSRRDIPDEDFRAMVREMISENAAKEEKKEFASLFYYQQGQFDAHKGYKDLAERLETQDREWRTHTNKLFYLAVPPEFYKTIFKNISGAGLTPLEVRRTARAPAVASGGLLFTGWVRIVVEKPFGKDLKTAEELDALLGVLFKEEQIYRIDHYLGKETVQNILAFRFSNSFFEPAWNNEHIERIEIRLLESRGVEDRADFYDGLGALRDVGQNHLLQLLALFTMENPDTFESDGIRKKRASLLRAVRIPREPAISRNAFRAQYAGFAALPGVRRGSSTETYFRIETFIDSARWRGVPIVLESGKSLSEEKAEVVVTFRHNTPCLCPTDAHLKNILTYHIQPQEGVTVSFWVKKPGTKMALEEKNFSFDYKAAYASAHRREAYEMLIDAALCGDQTLFVSTEEIMASWRVIDPIIRAWQKNKIPMRVYERGAFPKFLARAREEEPVTQTPFAKKEIGIVGLGKMGRNIALRLAEKGWEVRAFDQNPKAAKPITGTGISVCGSLQEIMQNCSTPRIMWLMVPAGHAVDEMLFSKNGILPFLSKGDIVIDGGNSFYEDSIRRAKKLRDRGVLFLDAGVSGGPEGARNGACIMIGGEKRAFQKSESLFRDLAIEKGYAHVGPSGAGHFVKMIHNGIEYGMMQAIAEGFSLIKKSRFKPNLKNVAKLYNRGSVIESRLLGWLAQAFEEYGENLGRVSGAVAHTGEGEWTVKTAKKLKIPAPVIERAFRFRVASSKNPSFTGKILSALRNQFGGHAVRK